MILILFWGILGAATTVEANFADSTSPHTVLEACQGAIDATAAFCEPGQADSCACTNSMYLSTVLGCMSNDEKFEKPYLLYLINDCKTKQMPISGEAISVAISQYNERATNVTKIPNFNKSSSPQVPILIDKALYNAFLESYNRSMKNLKESLYYGAALLTYWGLVMLAASITNWSYRFTPGLIRSLTGSFATFLRQHISLPALVTKSRSNKGKFAGLRLLIPSRAELLVLAIYVVLATIVCSVALIPMSDDPVFGSKYKSYLRHLADRTGVVGSLQIPVVILFAGRNNFLQIFTQWSYSTFIMFHRWNARVAFVLILIHGISQCIVMLDRIVELLKAPIIWNGLLSLVAMATIMLQSLIFLRSRWYEIFLLLHIGLAAAFIGGAWIHVEISQLPYVRIYHAAVGVWVAERVVRIFRLCVFGFPMADVTLVSDETLRVSIPHHNLWKPTPGGHAFVHFFRPSCFWQSHPFTFVRENGESDRIVMFLKVKGGMTHGLYRYLKSQNGKASIRVSVEGPYGKSAPVLDHDNAVYFAGGNGIPGLYSELMGVCSKNTSQTVTMFWSIREYKLLFWFYKELMALKYTKARVVVFITRPSAVILLSDFQARGSDFSLPRSKINNFSFRDEAALENPFNDVSSIALMPFRQDITPSDERVAILKVISSELRHIEFVEGHCNVQSVVRDFGKPQNGSTAFVACGHPSMVDEVRLAVNKNLKTGGVRLDFFEQLQIWA